MTIRNKFRLAQSLPLAAVVLAGSWSCLKSNGAVVLPGAPAETTPGTASFFGLTQVDFPGGAPADETFTVTGYDTSSNARYTATVESKVLAESTGTLDFAYKVTNLLTAQPDSIEYVSVNSYRGFTTDADFVPATGNVSYGTIGRSSIAGGVTLKMDFTPAGDSIAPGDSTDWVLIKTNAYGFDNLGSVNLLDGAPATATAFEPAVVPEPIATTIVPLGCIGLLTIRSRRKLKTA